MKFEMTTKYGDKYTADLDAQHGVHVPAGDADGYECRWIRPFCRATNDHQLGVHFWLKDGEPVKGILSNGAWAPGLNHPKDVAVGSATWTTLAGAQWTLNKGSGAFPLRFHVTMDLDGISPPV